MKRLGLALVLAMMTILPVRAADQDFTVVNRTGYQIDDIWVSASSSGRWGRELMGRGNVLVDGDSYDVNFPRSASGCQYDLKVKYNDGDEATWTGINVCNISKVSLFYDRKAGTTRMRTE